jgi:hypothetical protein
MKQILLILVIISCPTLLYAGSGCEVVNISLYDDLSVHGSDGHVSSSSRQCATVTVKNTSLGSRLGGKITAKFMDGQTKTKSFKSDRISEGQLFTTNICWGRKSQLESMECEF